MRSCVIVKKVKGWAALAASDRHNRRSRPVPNARPDEKIRVLFESGGFVATAKRIMIEHGFNPERMRRDGIPAVEMVLTAGHEFFHPGDQPEGAGLILDVSITSLRHVCGTPGGGTGAGW